MPFTVVSTCLDNLILLLKPLVFKLKQVFNSLIEKRCMKLFDTYSICTTVIEVSNFRE